jgi:amino acid transporter
LVDHLANAIESQLEENPKLTFDEALNAEFKKFGVFGFMGVVEEKQKFLGKKYNRLIWKYYKEFFRLPKIILTITLIYGVYILVSFFESPESVFKGMYFLMLIVSFFFFLKVNKELKNKQKQTRKKWLFEDYETGSTTIPLTILGFNSSIFFTNKIDFWTNEYSIIVSAGLVLIALYIFIQLKIIPKKVGEELAKNYPEYI